MKLIFRCLGRYKRAVALAIGITEKQMKKWKAPWL